MRLIEPRHPSRLEALHPRIVEDLLDIAAAGHLDAVEAIIVMLKDLVSNGMQTRYAKALKDTPLWELKTRSRGNLKGGTRVYWFPLRVTQDDQAETVAVIVNAEVKTGNAASETKLAETLEIYLAFKRDPHTMLRRSS